MNTYLLSSISLYSVICLIILFSVLIVTPIAAQSNDVYLTNVATITKSFATNSSITLQNDTVNYFDNTFGYLVYPLSSSKNGITNNNSGLLPAVVMIHENKGLNENIKSMANHLSKEGFVVLAVDLFNGEVTTNQTRASELTKSIRDNPATAIANLKSAVSYLKSLPNVNPNKIASLGWCFGGQQSLQLALNSETHPLSATVIYYGRLVTDENVLSKITWPVLGIFGDQDKSISVDTVNQFKEALQSNGIPNEIYIYKGVGHAFANPSGENYAPSETADAWQKTVSFLKKYTD